jgi:hypothetical protein
MPLDLAEAISELEAAPLVDVLVVLLFGEVAAGSFEDDPIELGGAELAGVTAGVEVEAGDSATAPDSIAAFLLLWVRLLGAAVVSLPTSPPTGSVPTVSEAFFFLFLDPVSLAVVEVSEAAVALSVLAAFFRFFDFFVAVAVSSVLVAAVLEEVAV